jgi:2-polyprenyl-3-methyl-5-hydroxy-6-metoxy-1,4-benzoquinol methylase
VITHSYFERFSTRKYRESSRLKRALIRRFVERFHSLFIAAGPADTVLEVGAGEGFLIGYLSEKFPRMRFRAVDLNGDDLRRLERLFPAVETQHGSIYDLSGLTGPFDIIVCAELLEHIDEPERGLTELLALQPQRVIVTVPHEPWFQLSNLLRGKNVSRLGNDAEHVNHWGPKSFRALLEPHFEILQLTASFPWLLALLKPR